MGRNLAEKGLHRSSISQHSEKILEKWWWTNCGWLYQTRNQPKTLQKM